MKQRLVPMLQSSHRDGLARHLMGAADKKKGITQHLPEGILVAPVLPNTMDAQANVFAVQMTVTTPFVRDIVFVAHPSTSSSSPSTGEETKDAGDAATAPPPVLSSSSSSSSESCSSGTSTFVADTVLDLSGDSLTRLIEKRDAEFEARFAKAFQSPSAVRAEDEETGAGGGKGDDGESKSKSKSNGDSDGSGGVVGSPDAVRMAKAALGNLLGSVTYFHGTSLVKKGDSKKNQAMQGRRGARCGRDWGHANDNCGTLCPSGSPNDCPRGQNCFGGLSEEICDLAAAERTSPAGPLLTGVPSRSFFPRGFMWDEGFHQLLVVRWDPSLTRSVVRHWLGRMDAKGWIAREQILGSEAESKVPRKFQVQDRAVANPPTLVLPVRYMLRQLAQLKGAEVAGGVAAEETEEDREALRFVRDVYPRLRRLYQFYLRTQKVPGRAARKFDLGASRFAWHGRTADHALASGLDDYPRPQQVSNRDRQVDLLSWIAFFAQFLAEAAEKLASLEISHPPSSASASALSSSSSSSASSASASPDYVADALKYGKDASKYKRAIEAYHYDEHEGVYCDVGIVAGEHRERCATHVGYVSLFPFLLQLMDPSSSRLPRILDALSDPEKLWSDYGVRSLSKSDPQFATGEHYWKGKLWINLNYLSLEALHYYAGSATDKAVARRAGELYVGEGGGGREGGGGIGTDVDLYGWRVLHAFRRV